MLKAILNSRAVRWMAGVIAALFALCIAIPVAHAQTPTTTWKATPEQLDSAHHAQYIKLLASALTLQQLLNTARTHRPVYRVATMNLCRKTDNWFMVTARSAPFARMRGDSVFYVNDPATVLLGDTLRLTTLCIGPGQVLVPVSDTTHVPL